MITKNITFVFLMFMTISFCDAMHGEGLVGWQNCKDNDPLEFNIEISDEEYSVEFVKGTSMEDEESSHGCIPTVVLVGAKKGFAGIVFLSKKAKTVLWERGFEKDYKQGHLD